MRPGAGQETVTGKSVTVLSHSQPPGESQQPSRATEGKHPCQSGGQGERGTVDKNLVVVSVGRSRGGRVRRLRIDSCD